MKRYTKTLAALLLTLVMLLTACGKPTDGTDAEDAVNEPLHLTVCTGEPQTTLDCGKATAGGSETILFHLYENLLRWENDGDGYAVLAPGQAASYTVEIDYAGNATYTFTLRDDIKWSDGEVVTSYHFAAAWKRLADPANDLPHRELMRVIMGYDEVQKSGDTDFLGISAPDARTFIVMLNGNPPYFLTNVCAGAYTMPIRHNPPNPDNVVTNGAYTVADYSNQRVSVLKSETYYDAANVTVETIEFVPSSDSETDYAKFLNGEAQLVEDLPVSVLQELTETEGWSSEPVTTTFAVAFNTLQAPFDSAEVRAALHLVIDEQVIVDALADYTSKAATGLVPCGVMDYAEREVAEEVEETEETLPDPNAPPKEIVKEPAVYWDFRAHSEEIVTVDIDSDYETDCNYARELMAKAGYKDGEGFPIVDYIFVNSEEQAIIAKVVQAMWREKLGVNVTLRALTQEDFDLALTPVEDPETALLVAPFQIAALELSAEYNDAGAILNQWHGSGAENFTGYASPAFDILLGAANAAVAADVYDAYLHDAEAILLTDAPLIPLCYRGGSYRLSDGLEGLYRGPNGVYFLSRVTRELSE